MSQPGFQDLQRFFDVFRDQPFDLAACRKAADALVEEAPLSVVIAATELFLQTETVDEARAWGTNVLERAGAAEARPILERVLALMKDRRERMSYKYTRFFALRALNALASESDREDFKALLRATYNDDDEDALPKAGAACMAARDGDRDAIERLTEMLEDAEGRYWRLWAVLRALREFPVERVARQLIRIMGDERTYLDRRYDVIQVLGRFSPTQEIVRAVGEVLFDRNSNEYLRLRAVITLSELGDSSARADLLHGLTDPNAEVRVQAAVALAKCLKEAAIPAVIEASLSEDLSDEGRRHYVEAVRILDRDRRVATELLGKDLGSEDRRRAEAAERLLLDLGGWGAVQRLSQRRSTLAQLDTLLASSEAVVQETFESTIKQARINFYFALAVNLLVVVVGLSFVVIAVMQLVQDPEQVGSWLAPGGTGLLAVLLNLTFNNPRRNARDDLATLINVNVLFLGFLRQLNEIDATFKHAYIESRDFDITDMQFTVSEIEESVRRTLMMAATHLRFRDGAGAPNHVDKDRIRMPPADRHAHSAG